MTNKYFNTEKSIKNVSLTIKYIFDSNIGYGDIKLMIGLVLLYGEECVLYSFAISSIVAYIYMKMIKKDRIAFLLIYNLCYILLLLFL